MMRPQLPMGLSTSQSLLWYLTVSLELILTALLLRRRIFRTFPVFGFFVLISTSRSFLLWAIYHWVGLASRPAVYAFWSTQAILLLSRAAVCAELCWHVFRRYSGLSPLTFSLLRRIGLALAAFALLNGLLVMSRSYSLMLTAERGLELSLAVVLVSLFLIALRYKITIPRTAVLLATGLCFYSLVQTLNNAFVHWLPQYFKSFGNFASIAFWWENFRIVAFHVTLAIWIWALARPADEPLSVQIQTTPKLYETHSADIARQLRALDEDLRGITRG